MPNIRLENMTLVDISSKKPKYLEKTTAQYYSNGELALPPAIGAITEEQFGLPLRIDMVVKSDRSLTLHYHKGSLGMNMFVTQKKKEKRIYTPDIFTGSHNETDKEKLDFSEFSDLTVYMDEKMIAVFINGEYIHSNYWHKNAIKNFVGSPITVSGSKVVIQSMNVSNGFLSSEMEKIALENSITYKFANAAQKLQQQKNDKSKFEDIVGSVLSGEKLTDILNFNHFLRANKLSLRLGSNNSWVARSGGKNVCYVKVFEDKASWSINPAFNLYDHNFDEYEKQVTDENMQSLVLSGVASRRCRHDCGIQNKSLFGKTFDLMCRCHTIEIRNPNVEQLEILKKLVLIIKQMNANYAKDNKS